MSEMIEDNRAIAVRALLSIYEQSSSIQSKLVQPPAKRLLPVLDAPDVKTFRNRAEKVWRLYHPQKRGRTSEQKAVCEICIMLYRRGLIDLNLSLGKLCTAVTKSFEDKREQHKAIVVPHEDTIRKFVKEWKKDVTENVRLLEVMRKALPWAP